MTVVSSYMVRFSPNIIQQKQIYSCKANSLGVVSCSYNERTNRYVFTDACQQITYMVKQLNYVLLTADLTA